MKIYTYDNTDEEINSIEDFSIFLAGPTVRYEQQHLISWRKEAIKILHDIGFEGSVIIPEFKKPVKFADFDVPLWEYNALKKADKIIFWIPRTEELIGLTTNFELGFWVAKNMNKIFYGRPDTAYRIKYCDTIWNAVNRDNNTQYPIFTDLYKMLKQIKG